MKSIEAPSKKHGKTTHKAVIQNPSTLSTEERRNCISTAAYYKAEARAFTAGGELNDWLEAEAEFNKVIP